MPEQFHGYKPAILAIGDEFVFETIAGRTGTGRVRTVNTQEHMQKNPYEVVWTDQNGKHYEWFGLQEFKVIIKL